MEPEGYNAGSRGAAVPENTLLYVEETAEGGDFVRVTYNGSSGWLRWVTLRGIEKVRAKRARDKRIRQQREEQRRRKAAFRDSIRRKVRAMQEEEAQKRAALREEGFGIMLSSMSRRINSADGIAVYIAGENIEQEKTIKYVTFTLQLFNPVGDAARGRIRTPSRTTLRGIGPIAPGEPFRYEFDSVWYSAAGDCVELLRVHVEHVDGSTFTYVNDLKPVTRHSQRGVNLRGDCQL
jgi:hypothetical protein